MDLSRHILNALTRIIPYTFIGAAALCTPALCTLSGLPVSTVHYRSFAAVFQRVKKPAALTLFPPFYSSSRYRVNAPPCRLFRVIECNVEGFLVENSSILRLENAGERHDK